MSTTEEKILVMQAFARGEPIECSNSSDPWTIVKDPIWNWLECNYRVAPKPKVKLWLWILFFEGKSPCLTQTFFKDEERVREIFAGAKHIKPALWTEIEVDE